MSSSLFRTPRGGDLPKLLHRSKDKNCRALDGVQNTLYFQQGPTVALYFLIECPLIDGAAELTVLLNRNKETKKDQTDNAGKNIPASSILSNFSRRMRFCLCVRRPLLCYMGFLLVSLSEFAIGTLQCEGRAGIRLSHRPQRETLQTLLFDYD